MPPTPSEVTITKELADRRVPASNLMSPTKAVKSAGTGAVTQRADDGQQVDRVTRRSTGRGRTPAQLATSEDAPATTMVAA